MMDFCEEMLRAVVFKVLGHTHVKFGEQEIDFGAVSTRGMKESLAGLAPIPDQITTTTCS
jgi:lysyl-tRNA synthetase class II